MTGRKNYAVETLPSRAGNHPETHHGIIDPAVYHASTVLFPTVALRASLKLFGRAGAATRA